MSPWVLPLYFIRWCYYKEWTGMKLFLPRGDIAWFVDKFSRSVHRIVGHRTVSKAIRQRTSLYGQGWCSTSIGNVYVEGMMDKSLLYVGVDVGQDEVWGVVEGAKPRQFRHTATGIRALGHWAQRHAGGAGTHFCMEATGVYSRSVAVRLLDGDYGEVSIVNPAQIAAYARAQLRRTKTDQVDARVILSFAQSQRPTPWTPESPALRQLIHLVRQADVMRGELQRWANRRHGQRHTADLPAVVRTATARIIRSYRCQLANLEREIDRLLAVSTELQQQVELLCSIPGVAQLSAVRLLAYARGTITTHSAKALIAHAGLAPRHYQSGRSVRGKSRLAKQGDKRLRTTLYMPALVGTVHNPLLRSLYRRLLEAGKPKKLALAACMKKLLLLARAIIRKQKPFNPGFQP
jgi:transposase